MLTILATGLCCQTPEILESFGMDASLPDKSLLPAAMRRRTSLTTRLAVTAATHACQHAGLEPKTMPSVFASVGGEIQVTDSLCRNLVDPDGIISPTQFHNSVHNTTVGYWTILHQCRRSSTAIAALDDTFAMGLLEAWNQVQLGSGPILLVCYDEEWPQYLAPPTGKTALACAFIVADSNHAGPKITRPGVKQGSGIRDQESGGGAPEHADSRFLFPDSRLETLAREAPAAAALPLLQAMSDKIARSDIPLNHAGIPWQTDLHFD
jgi:Beta-ketoacyl synthase, N-terminal domain